MTDSQTAIEIDTLLSSLPEEIETKGQEVITRGREYREAKAAYEMQYQKTVLAMKAHDPEMTQTDLKASAVVSSHADRMAMIIKQSEYEKARKELQKLRDEFDALKERSYNYRCEMKVLKG